MRHGAELEQKEEKLEQIYGFDYAISERPAFIYGPY